MTMKAYLLGATLVTSLISCEHITEITDTDIPDVTVADAQISDARSNVNFVDITGASLFVADATLGVLQIGPTILDATPLDLDCMPPNLKTLAVDGGFIRGTTNDWIWEATLDGDCRLMYHSDPWPIGIAPAQGGFFLLTAEASQRWLAHLSWPESWPNANGLQNVTSQVVASPRGMFEAGGAYYTFTARGSVRSFDGVISLGDAPFPVLFDAVVRVGDDFIYWDADRAWSRDLTGTFTFLGTLPYSVTSASMALGAI